MTLADAVARFADNLIHHPDMVAVRGGTFRMGSDRHYPEEAPAHRVTVDGFWIDRAGHEPRIPRLRQRHGLQGLSPSSSPTRKIIRAPCPTC